jgi:outer membrane protein assembly factor BamB
MYRIVLSLLAVLTLTGCGAGTWLGEAEDPPLPGQRISIMSMQSSLEPDPDIRARDFEVPSIWENQFWPQEGGYPDHAMRHLSLSGLTNGLTAVWEQDIGTGAGDARKLTTSPVVVDNMVYAMDSQSKISAYGIDTGDRIWRVDAASMEERGYAPPGGLAFGDGYLFVTSGYGRLIALDPMTGQRIWMAGLGAPARAAPTIKNGRVFVLTLTNQLIAFDAQSGEKLWQYDGLISDTRLFGAPSPAVNGNRLIAAFSNGRVIAFRAENGQQIWQDNLAGFQQIGQENTLSDIRALPVIDDGLVFTITNAGRMAATDLATGRRIWDREMSGIQTPWVVGQYVFVVTEDHELVALLKETGGIRWVSDLPELDKTEDRWLSPRLADGRLLVAGTNGDLLTINPASGGIDQRLSLTKTMAVPPVIAQNSMFTLGRNARLTRFK